MAFKMKGFSGFKQTIEQPKDHQKKFFTQKHREIEPDREGGLDPISVISTETVGKEKNWRGSIKGTGGKLKEFKKITDEKTGEVKYVKRKGGKWRSSEVKEKEISEKKFLSKKKRYQKKKGHQTYHSHGARTRREQWQGYPGAKGDKLIAPYPFEEEKKINK